MQIAELQARVKEADRASRWDLIPTALLSCHLFEELGELVQVVNRAYHDRGGEAKRREHLGLELADALWLLVKLANRFDIDLERQITPLLVRMETSPPEAYQEELLSALRNMGSELDAARDQLDWGAHPKPC